MTFFSRIEQKRISVARSPSMSRRGDPILLLHGYTASTWPGMRWRRNWPASGQVDVPDLKGYRGRADAPEADANSATYPNA